MKKIIFLLTVCLGLMACEPDSWLTGVGIGNNSGNGTGQDGPNTEGGSGSGGSGASTDTYTEDQIISALQGGWSVVFNGGSNENQFEFIGHDAFQTMETQTGSDKSFIYRTGKWEYLQSVDNKEYGQVMYFSFKNETFQYHYSGGEWQSSSTDAVARLGVITNELMKDKKLHFIDDDKSYKRDSKVNISNNPYQDN